MTISQIRVIRRARRAAWSKPCDGLDRRGEAIAVELARDYQAGRIIFA